MDCVSFVDRCFEGAFIQFKLTKMGGGGNRGRGGKWDEYGIVAELLIFNMILKPVHEKKGSNSICD